MIEDKNILEIKNVTVSFDGFKALNSLSLEIKKSQMIAIIGPNGAGKTTLQDVITGKTKIDDGKIFFKNNDLSQFTEHEIVNLGIGRKFQRPTIIENISVWDNLCIALNTRKNFLSCLLFKLKNKDLKKVVEIISIINLEKKKNLIAKNLSHGEKQWLEIGMLLIQQSDLLLIDEPVAGMTEIETKKTSELLINISKDRTVLVVEHDMNFIESLDVEVVVLNEGSVLTRGSMKNIKKNKQVIDVYLGR
ncbi:MAG: ABC transporter ATP-binding protein [Alphaproteobacteria bacterium]|nr:MAG: ABC transporter ATP-binding protein [Alphaproteobacteria bacterium]